MTIVDYAYIFRIVLMLVFMGVVLYCFWRARRGKISYVRPIPGIVAMEEAVGRATEMGKMVLFVTGYTDIQKIETYTSMSVLDYTSRLAARMRVKMKTLVSRPDVYPLIEATMRQAYMSEGAPELFQPQEQLHFISDNSVVYAAGVSRIVEEEQPGCVIFFGGFDFTALLLSEPGARLGTQQIAGDPTLFQMPFFVCTCDHTIIAEEYFAAGAYVNPDPKMRNSLLGQDLIKLSLAVLIIFGLLMLHLSFVFKWLNMDTVARTCGWFVELLKSYSN